MIKIKKAYENNLKNISVNIPKNKITSIIGISGSGKSSLIYNVIANEAKRQEKIDSGHAKCFDYAIRPKFEEISNLPYCITLKQRGLTESISSTIATLTGLHQLLREEFVKYGQILGKNGNLIEEPTIPDIKNFINKYYHGVKFNLFAVVCDEQWTEGKQELKILNENKINEALFLSSYDNKEKMKKISSVKKLNDKYSHTILVPIRDINDLEKYKNVAIKNFMVRNNDICFKFYIDYFDIQTGVIYQKKSTKLLSFNSVSKYSGRCLTCKGHGLVETIIEESLFSDKKRLHESFLNIKLNKQGRYEYIILFPSSIEKELKKEKIDLSKTYFDLSSEDKKIVQSIIYPKIFKHCGKPSIGKFIQTKKCLKCKGTRLNYKANAIKLYNQNISDILKNTINDLDIFFKNKEVHHKKILLILKSLKKATLGYLTLARSTDTLSGGELQRLKFALELNSDYTDLLYILDEPSSGLHPYNNHQMINMIKLLKDRGNTILLSEHNKDYIDNSDYVIELGPKSGEAGGEIVFEGEKKEFLNYSFSRKKLNIDLEKSIKLIGVNSNNIHNENFIIPLHGLVAISGVSGSGKSSLIHHVLCPTVKQYIADATFEKTLVQEVSGIEAVNAIVELTQAQIGINSRSIVATYLNIFDKIRTIYSSLKISKEFKFDKGYFSFNSSIGACANCNGLGELEENVVCPSCLGERYKPEVLDVRFNTLNIIELLNTSIDNLLHIFEDEKLKFALSILKRLGLSHITLGRTTPTLSGGEAQRLKLAKTLIESFHKIKKGNFLFVLDEPTTGLNNKDTERLYEIFDELISYKNSIIIIEHNLEIIKNSDFIIDMGVGSGEEGGKNIFSGSYNKLLKNKQSLTAKAFNNEYEYSEDLKTNLVNLKSKTYTKQDNPSCNEFYFDINHFEIEKKFASNYKLQQDDKNFKFFKFKNELFEFVKQYDNVKIFFNPYVSELFKYKTIPLSLKKSKLEHLKKLGFKISSSDINIDEWDYRIAVENVEKAYNYGNGWITIKHNNNCYELSTRLVSLKNKLIGTPNINEYTFNLYFNSCIYCNGEGIKQAYDLKVIISDRNKSILDKDFFTSNIKISLKRVVEKFKSENLFDFTKPFSSLTTEEKNIFLFGFREHKFLKAKGKPNIQSDYVEWKGLYSYIYHDLKKIKISDEIKKSQHSTVCPFCINGFKKEIKYYFLDKKNILDYLHKI